MSLDRQARQIAILLQPDMLAISRFVVVGPTRPLLGSGSASRVVPAVENSAFAYQMFPPFGSRAEAQWTSEDPRAKPGVDNKSAVV